MGKRKHTSYTIEEKLAAVSRFRNGVRQCTLVKELGVNESTLRSWIRSEDTLRAHVDKADGEPALKMRRVNPGRDPVRDDVVFGWFVTQRSEGVPLSGPMVQEQALKVAAQLHPDAPEQTFQASKGWLARWKRRHGIRAVKIAGEARSADLEAAEAFLPRLQALVEEEGLTPDQVFNADETGLSYRMTPDRSLAQQSDPNGSVGHKQMKERVTVLLACNWTGSSKLKPLVIGRFENPRCFHHVNKSTLPVTYRHSAKSWMTAGIFTEWFKTQFVPAVRAHLRREGLPIKAVLLLDNCPAHPPADTLVSRCGGIKVVYLPPNTTSKIQPLDQGIIATVKRAYRRLLIRGCLETDFTITQYLKSITVKDACHLLGEAWASVSSASIRATWDSALGNPFEHPEEQPAEEEFLGFTEEEVEEACARSEARAEEFEDLLSAWASCDNQLPVCQPTTIADLLPQSDSEEDPEPESDSAPAPEKLSASKALECAEYLKLWLEQQEGEGHRVIQMTTLARDIRRQADNTKKQTTLSSYFTSQ